VYRFWAFLLKFNSLLGGYITVIITSGVFFASIQAGNDDLSAFTQSFLSGLVAATVLMALSDCAYKVSRFRETSERHLYNETHWSMMAVFLCYIIVMAVCSFALKNINDYCSLTQKPCQLKRAFITSN